MRIAMIGHKQVPSREGGIEVVVEELAAGMVERGHEVVLYNRWHKGMLHAQKEYRGVALRDVPAVNIKGSDAVAYSGIAAFSSLFAGYDIIHFHAEGPAGMSWLPRLVGIPTVVTIHGLDWQRGKWGSFASSYLKLSERVAARCADEIIVLSDNMRKYFSETYGRATTFLRNGIRVGEPKPPEEIAKLGLKGNDYILFLARLVPEKGLHYLLDAFRGIDTGLKLVIAGRLNSTEYVDSIREAASKDDRVVLAGFVQGRLQEELFSNCRLYVLPSDIEGMPLSLLEALSFGAPCLASDIEENRVAPGEYLSLFKRGQRDDLGRKLEASLRAERPAQARAAQMDWMRAHYAWSAVVDGTLSLYQAAINRKKSQ